MFVSVPVTTSRRKFQEDHPRLYWLGLTTIPLMLHLAPTIMVPESPECSRWRDVSQDSTRRKQFVSSLSLMKNLLISKPRKWGVLFTPVAAEAALIGSAQ